MENKPEYIAPAPTRIILLSDLISQIPADQLCFHLEQVVNGTGWGEVVVTIKAGRVDEISSRQTEKVRI